MHENIDLFYNKTFTKFYEIWMALKTTCNKTKIAAISILLRTTAIHFIMFSYVECKEEFKGLLNPFNDKSRYYQIFEFSNR